MITHEATTHTAALFPSTRRSFFSQLSSRWYLSTFPSECLLLVAADPATSAGGCPPEDQDRRGASQTHPFKCLPKAGVFGAWEQPELFATEPSDVARCVDLLAKSSL